MPHTPAHFKSTMVKLSPEVYASLERFAKGQRVTVDAMADSMLKAACGIPDKGGIPAGMEGKK